MISLALLYILPVLVLIRISFTGDKMVREMLEITKREGSHPARIELTLKIKQRQKWIDRMALMLALVGIYHVALRGGLI